MNRFCLSIGKVFDEIKEVKDLVTLSLLSLLVKSRHGKGESNCLPCMKKQMGRSSKVEEKREC